MNLVRERLHDLGRIALTFETCSLYCTCTGVNYELETRKHDGKMKVHDWHRIYTFLMSQLLERESARGTAAERTAKKAKTNSATKTICSLSGRLLCYW